MTEQRDEPSLLEIARRSSAELIFVVLWTLAFIADVWLAWPLLVAYLCAGDLIGFFMSKRPPQPKGS